MNADSGSQFDLMSSILCKDARLQRLTGEESKGNEPDLPIQLQRGPLGKWKLI